MLYKLNICVIIIVGIYYQGFVKERTILIINEVEAKEIRIELDEWLTGEFTAYNPTQSQCDSTPRITASQKQIKEGMIACPSKYKFGTKIEIEGLGVYTCEDRMNIRYDCFRQKGGCKEEKFYFDIVLEDYNKAINFGRQSLKFKL